MKSILLYVLHKIKQQYCVGSAVGRLQISFKGLWHMNINNFDINFAYLMF